MIFCKKLEKEVWKIEHKPKYSVGEVVGIYYHTPYDTQKERCYIGEILNVDIQKNESGNFEYKYQYIYRISFRDSDNRVISENDLISLSSINSDVFEIINSYELWFRIGKLKAVEKILKENGFRKMG